MTLDKRKSAKDYIAESYNVEIEAIQERNSLLETPASLMEKEKKESILSSANEIIEMNILNEETTGEYITLDNNIKAKKAEIKKLYNIDINDDSLKALKKAYQILAADFETDLKERSEEFSKNLEEEFETAKNEIDEAEKETEKEVEAIYTEIRNRREKEKINVKREKEEYEYNLNLKRRDEKDEREKVIAEREAELCEKESEVKNKLDEVEEELRKIDELQAKVDDIPNQLEQAKIFGAEEKSKELGKEYGYKTYLAEQDAKREYDVIQKQFERTESKYKDTLMEIENLQGKLDKCNAESRQLATDTVKSTGGINILNSENTQTGKK